MLNKIKKIFQAYKHPYSDVPLLIISGIGRSGTTMLRTALGSHPSIDYNGQENNVFVDLLGVAHHNCTYPSRKVAMKVKQKVYNRIFKNTLLQLLYPEPLTKKPQYVMVYSALTPEVLDYSQKVFDNVFVVNIVRNAIEVVSSRTVYEGFNKNEFENHLDTWNRGVELIKYGEKTYPSNFLNVRHEQFLEKQKAEDVFKLIQQKLGLDYSESPIRFHQSTVVHPTKMEGEKDTISLEDRKKRWKYWGESERLLFEEKCRASMQYLGYELPWS